MPNGLYISTKNGLKPLPIRPIYGLEQGRLRFEQKDLTQVFFQLIGEGKGFRMEGIGKRTDPSITPANVGKQLLAIIGKNGFSLFADGKVYRFNLSTTHQPNYEYHGMLPAFLKKALGDVVQIQFS